MVYLTTISVAQTIQCRLLYSSEEQHTLSSAISSHIFYEFLIRPSPGPVFRQCQASTSQFCSIGQRPDAGANAKQLPFPGNVYLRSSTLTRVPRAYFFYDLFNELLNVIEGMTSFLLVYRACVQLVLSTCLCWTECVSFICKTKHCLRNMF